ncbi:unnamed protein product [Schistosoma mattheei]|uniref:Uncharacterized protein n=1 Tax=Schistosoma mattheei TaxID=31246 RepID=A0AA85B5D2_9TREM|nr:unnamed protein product [Schistosoma mattheei]
MKNFFEGLGKSRGKNDISGRTSPVNLKPLESNEESNTGKNTKDTIEKTNNASDKSREVIKGDEKKTEKQTSPADATNKFTNKADDSVEAPQDKPPSTVRLIDRVNQGPTNQINEKNPSSTLINFLTSPVQTIKSNRAPSPTTPPKTKPVDEVKDLETDKKSSDLKEKQNKNSKNETNEVQSKKVESQPNINVGQKKEITSSSQPAPNTKTQEVLNKDNGNVQTTKSKDDKVSESQNKSNNIVTESASEVPVKKTLKDKPENETQVSKPEVSQSNTNYLVPSNIPQPDTNLKLGRKGVITRSEGEQLKPYHLNSSSPLEALFSKITGKHNDPPDLSLTSDKGVNRSINTGQKECEKYNESQRIDLKNLDPCRPVFFSAIDLKRSGFANAEDIEIVGTSLEFQMLKIYSNI